MKLKFILLGFLIKIQCFAGIEILVQPRFRQPHDDFFKSNYEQNFEHDEIWLIDNKAAFLRYLQTQSWPTERIDLIRRVLQSEFDKKTVVQIISHYSTRQVQAVVRFDQELQSLLQDYEVIDIYRYLLDHQNTGFFQYFLSEKHFLNEMKNENLTDQQIEIVKKLLIDVDNQLYLFYHRKNWPNLPEQLKKYYFTKKIDTQVHRQGLDLQFKIEDLTDLQVLIQRYSNYINIETIEAELLRQFRDGVRLFPLALFMPSVVKMNLFNYSKVCGPNCLNAAVSFHQGDDFQLQYIDRKDLEQELKNYDFIQNGIQNIQIGDLIVFENKEGKADHAAVLVADGFVFTKNGASKYNPYLFQSIEQLFTVYPVKSKTQIKIYRKQEKLSVSDLFKLEQVTKYGRYCEQVF